MSPKRRVDFEVPEGAVATECTSCRAAIVFVELKERPDGSPRRMPLDLLTAQRGLDGVVRCESHFAHCPDAETHRRRRAGGQS